MSTKPNAVSKLDANQQANLNGQVDHFPAQNDNVKSVNETISDNHKERSLCIVYKTSAKKRTINVLQEHQDLMALLFEADPNLKLLPQFLDDEPIKKIEDFPKEEDAFKCLVKVATDPCDNKQAVVIQRILTTKTIGSFKFENEAIMEYLKMQCMDVRKDSNREIPLRNWLAR